MSRTFVWRGERSLCENTKKSPFGGFSRGAFSPRKHDNTKLSTYRNTTWHKSATILLSISSEESGYYYSVRSAWYPAMIWNYARCSLVSFYAVFHTHFNISGQIKWPVYKPSVPVTGTFGIAFYSIGCQF